MDRMARNGKKVILATPSGARPAWLDRNHPEVLRMNADRTRNLHGGRHNHCYTSPYYRKKVWEMDQMLAKRYQNRTNFLFHKILCLICYKPQPIKL